MAHLYSAGAARRPGRNVLAVQVHQHAPESSDAGFDLELTGIVQPPLDASRTAAQITLTTSAAFLNRAPEHSGSPGGPSAVTAPPVQSGGLLHYTLPVTAPLRFFRMRQTGIEKHQSRERQVASAEKVLPRTRSLRYVAVPLSVPGFPVRLSPLSVMKRPNLVRSALTAGFLSLLATLAIAAPGDPDPSFSPVTTNGYIYSMLVRPDGRILIGGSFDTVNGVARSRIAQLLPNGALDPSFNYSASGTVNTMAMQLDGRCVIGGAFGLARLSGNGTLDAGFLRAVTANVSSLGLGPENKIIFISGWTIKRALPDGGLDAGFSTAASGNSLAVFGSGGFMASRSDGNTTASLTMCDSEGRVLDARTFSGWGHPSDIVYSGVTTLLGNGTTCGSFSGFYGYDGGRSFSSSPGYPGQTGSEGMVGQADGKVIFSSGVRINADGTRDIGFAPAGAPLMAVQADGGLLLPSTVSSTTTLTRRLNDPVIESLIATDARRVQWLRGGAGPVAAATQFELSTDGGVNWTLLGPGGRIPGGWELTGLNLPGRGKLRARARTASMRSYGLVETTADFTVSPTLPRLAVLANDAELISGGSGPVDFGRIAPGGSASRIFTVRNTGWGDLTDLAVTLSAEGQPGDFAVAPPALTTLERGEETSFTVTLMPAAAGVRTATLLIASNDPDVNPFQIPLSGTRSTALEEWRQQYFGAFTGTGPSADLADPDGDGQVNLIEFATGGHPLEFTPPVGALVKNGTNLEFTYTRPARAVAELSYLIERTTSLSAAWTSVGVVTSVLSDDGVTQMVRATVSAGTGKRFIRLCVTRQ